MPFPPITLHPRISSPGKELFRKKKANLVPPQSVLNGAKSKEEKECEKEKLSTSWPSANLKQLGLKPQSQASKLATAHRAPVDVGAEGKSSWLALPPPPPPHQHQHHHHHHQQQQQQPVSGSISGDSGAHKGSKHAAAAAAASSSSSTARSSLAKEEGDEEIRFTLSLTPEAIVVIQKRNLEKQMMAKQQKCCASGDFRHRRVFPSKRAQGGSKSGGGGGSGGPAPKPEKPEDIRAIVKISLLNDQYKYDDVEYEEEDGDVDETVVRKCKEWLKGVESAAAFAKVDKLAAVQHLKSC